MTITADTHVLVRALTGDHKRQSAVAKAELAGASAIVLALPALCELVRVLSQGYGVAATDFAEAIRCLVDAENVLVNRPAVDAGLALLQAGGDFADGVIAYEGRAFGADTFVSFDRKAVKLLQRQGEAARLLS